MMVDPDKWTGVVRQNTKAAERWALGRCAMALPVHLQVRYAERQDDAFRGRLPMEYRDDEWDAG